jgi:hypothetical protein
MPLTEKLTFDQMTEHQRQKVGEALWNRERPRCQSSLIDDLVKEERDGFGIDEIENLTPDPSDWGIVRCREYLRDNGHDCPEPNPWTMQTGEMLEALGGADSFGPDLTPDRIQQEYIDAIDREEFDGIENWRNAVRDNAEPAEIYEWWEVGDWLAERLACEGECVIRNGLGDWWGRCCTGQAAYLDSVIQRLGAEYCGWALDKS